MGLLISFWLGLSLVEVQGLNVFVDSSWYSTDDLSIAEIENIDLLAD